MAQRSVLQKQQDFKTFTRIENPFLPFNRNAVLIPEKDQ